MKKDRNDDPQKTDTQQEPEMQQAVSQPSDNACAEPDGKVTEAVALARATTLIKSYKPTTAMSILIHRIFTFLTLSVESGSPVFSEHLIACYTDRNDNDIGEPPPVSAEWEYLHLRHLLANLEDMIEQGRNGIAEQAENDFRQMRTQATDNAALAKAYLDINEEIGDSPEKYAQYAYVGCLTDEFAKARRANPDLLVSLRDKVREAAQTQSAEQAQQDEKARQDLLVSSVAKMGEGMQEGIDTLVTELRESRQANQEAQNSVMNKMSELSEKVQSNDAETKGKKSGRRQNKQWLDKVCKEVLMLWNSWCANGGRKRYRDFLEAHKGRPVFQTYIKDMDDLEKCLNAAKKAEKQKNAGK